MKSAIVWLAIIGGGVLVACTSADIEQAAPCKPLPGHGCSTAPFCGCASGENCVVTDGSKLVCVKAGSASINTRCDRATDCQPGATCIFMGVGGAAEPYGVCKSYCATSDDCQRKQAGSECVDAFTSGEARVRTCDDAPCNPVDAASCGGTAACRLVGQPGGKACSTTTCRFACRAGGTGKGAGGCSGSLLCAPGHICASGGHCSRWCDSFDAPCLGGGTCRKHPDLGDLPYGICDP